MKEHNNNLLGIYYYYYLTQISYRFLKIYMISINLQEVGRITVLIIIINTVILIIRMLCKTASKSNIVESLAFIIYSSKNPEEAELEDILNSVVSSRI